MIKIEEKDKENLINLGSELISYWQKFAVGQENIYMDNAEIIENLESIKNEYVGIDKAVDVVLTDFLSWLQSNKLAKFVKKDIFSKYLKEVQFTIFYVLNSKQRVL